MECRGLCPLPVPLTFPTIAGVGEWRIGGEGEERRGRNHNTQEGGNKGGVKIKGGRTKRKGFQLHNLGDAFLWCPDTNLPKNLK
jgi:hypothetical protein